MPFSFEGLFRCSCIPFLRLEVVGATEVIVPGGPNYWVADYSAIAANITVEAFTVLGTHVDWTATTMDPGAVPGPVHDVTLHHTDRCRIPLNNDRNVVADGYFITVQATALGLTANVNIVVKPLVTALAVVPNQYAFQDAAGWYALNLNGIANVNAAQLTAQLEVATTPNNAAALSHVVWAAINTAAGGIGFALAPVNEQRRGIPLDAVRTIQTTVTLLNSPQVMPAAVVVDVRNPAVNAALANTLGVQLHEFTFDGAGHFNVTQEDGGQYNNPYSADWTNGVAATPQGYTADDNATLNNVTLEVTAVPNANTTVHVRASAYWTHQNGAVTVEHAADNVVINNGALVGSQHIVGNFNFGDVPNEVMLNNPFLIFWEVSSDAGANWLPLRITANTVFVTGRAPAAIPFHAGDPDVNDLNNPVGGDAYTYLSLLEMSCEAANGLAGGGGVADVNAVRDAIAGIFNPANPNADVNRITPGAVSLLRYWGPNAADALNTAHYANTMFTAPNGAMQCGAWAQLLMAMWALHGKNDSNFIAVDTNAVLAVGAVSFLVRNWDYNNLGNMNGVAFTHAVVAGPPPLGGGNEVCSVLGVPGQNNANPPAQFGNHFIVLDNGNGMFYDPSYGTGPKTDQNWVYDSTAGLRSNANTAGYATQNITYPNNVRPNANVVTFTNKLNNAVIY